jgi:hypothetical protein
VGSQAAASFYGFRKNKDIRIPSTKDLLENYQKVRSDILKLIEKKHMEVLNYIIRKIIAGFTDSELHSINVNELLKDLPEELQVLFFKCLSLYRREDMAALTEKLSVFESISDRIIDIMNGD